MCGCSGELGHRDPPCTPCPSVSVVGEAIMLAVLDATAIEELHTLSSPDVPDFVETLITLFLDQTPLVLDTLEAALVIHDLLTVRILAGRLKGSSATLGGLRLALLCEVLDVRLR